MPNTVERPPSVVGARGDDAPEELRHGRTVARGKERYEYVWPSGRAVLDVPSEQEDKVLAKKKVAKVKLRHKVGNERYERNPHEPIKVP